PALITGYLAAAQVPRLLPCFWLTLPSRRADGRLGSGVIILGTRKPHSLTRAGIATFAAMSSSMANTNGSTRLILRPDSARTSLPLTGPKHRSVFLERHPTQANRTDTKRLGMLCLPDYPRRSARPCTLRGTSLPRPRRTKKQW